MGQSRAGVDDAVLWLSPVCVVSFKHHSQLVQVRTALSLPGLGQKTAEQ